MLQILQIWELFCTTSTIAQLKQRLQLLQQQYIGAVVPLPPVVQSCCVFEAHQAYQGFKRFLNMSALNSTNTGTFLLNQHHSIVIAKAVATVVVRRSSSTLATSCSKLFCVRSTSGLSRVQKILEYVSFKLYEYRNFFAQLAPQHSYSKGCSQCSSTQEQQYPCHQLFKVVACSKHIRLICTAVKSISQHYRQTCWGVYHRLGQARRPS